jgi:murein DD-endopeptidase MepM/ murein hydrolase activator NlpD
VLAARPAFADVRFDGNFVQGGLVHAHTTPGATVTLDGRRLRLTPDGEFLFGFGRDAGATATLDIVYPDGTKETKTLAIAPRQWDIQRIEGLPERQVTPPAADLARIHDDVVKVTEARKRDTPETLFRTGFIWPAQGPISGVYGSQRILNGQPRAPHYGLDIAAPSGAPIVAPADGIVGMVADMFFTGNTLALDHGYGLNTVYSHMSVITVKLGQRVKQGQMIGKVGATGRVTGAHLDWRVNLFDVRLDPALLLPPVNPANAGAATATGPGAGGSTSPSAH